MSYDGVVRQLEESFEKGEISEEEYHDSMRDILIEAKERAQEAAERAYDDEMGY